MTTATARAGSRVVDIDEVVEAQRPSLFLVATVLLCMAILVVDGFDVMVVGFVAPTVARSFGVAGSALTPVFVAGQIGLAAGAFVAGPLADRLGRRRTILICTLFFAACTLTTPLADTVLELALLRAVTGIGLGGILPNAIALVSETTPRRFRAATVMVMFSGFSIGSALAGLVASRVVGAYGWQAPFLIGGTLPLLLLPLLFLFLPESVRLLALKTGRTAEIAAVLRRMGHPTSEEPVTYLSGEAPVDRRPVAALFSDGRAPMTIALWVTFFANLLALNLLAAWLPTYLMTFSGFEPAGAAGIATWYQVGGTVGTLMLGLAIDRLGAAPVLAVSYALAALAIAAIGAVGHGQMAVALVLGAAGFFVVGGQIGINAYAGALYPTAMRSTGVAWAFGVGRFGAMSGPALGGAMLARRFPAELTFILAALPITVAIVSVLLVARFAARVDRRAQAAAA